MPTYYVEDYDGKRNDDAADRLELKVVEEAPAEKPAPKKTSRAQTK